MRGRGDSGVSSTAMRIRDVRIPPAPPGMSRIGRRELGVDMLGYSC